MKINGNMTSIERWWIGLLALLLLGCARFYKPVQATVDTPASAGQVIQRNLGKYLILHQGKYTYAMTEVRIDTASQHVQTTLRTVHPVHRQYLQAEPRQYSYETDSVLNEVHIYSLDTVRLQGSQAYLLPFSKIGKIELIEKDRKRTSRQVTLITAISLGVIITVLVIGASTFSIPVSFGFCPLVSTMDSGQAVLQGDLFAGAMSQSLQREDYLPLAVKPFDQELIVLLQNDLRESDYIDMADLLVVEHPTQVQAAIGDDGTVFTLAALIPPEEAILNNARNVLSQVTGSDQAYCHFDDLSRSSSVNEVVLTFPGPGQAKNGRLVLDVKNSCWLEYLFNAYVSQTGDHHDVWDGMVSRRHPGKLIHWMTEQDIPLRISVRQHAGWREVKQLNMVGSTANRRIVIPLELSPGGEDFQVKLTTGFMFWDLDYAAMDFSPQDNFTTAFVQPDHAVDEAGKSMLSELSHKDGKYLQLAGPEGSATLRYHWDKPMPAGKTYSFFLSASGFYLAQWDYAEKADMEFLKGFNKPGAMSRYSASAIQSALREWAVSAPE